MRTVLLSVAVVFAVAGRLSAHGLLIPEDRQLPPLAMVHHRVKIDIKDQVAVTEVEQSFRNHTDRPLEATYVFPVPRGASVNKFTMLVDGKESAHALDHSADRIPVGRPGSPDDVVRAVLFFCSPAADFVTGQVMSVAGGWRL